MSKTLCGVVVVCGVLWGGGAVWAQEEDGPRRGGPMQTEQVVEFLREELSLDATQIPGVTAAVEESMQVAMQRMAELWGSGEQPDRAAMRDAFVQMRVDMANRVSESLTPAQQREFEVLVEQFDRRMQGWDRGRRASEDPVRWFDPPRFDRRLLLAKAERSLFLEPDEAAVVLPYIEEVVDRRLGLLEGRRIRREDLRSAIDGGASRDEIEDRLEEIRVSEDLQQLELVAAQHRLRDLLTVEQEVRFVAMGLLD